MSKTASDNHRQAYLDALGIDVWRLRGAEESAESAEADVPAATPLPPASDAPAVTATEVPLTDWSTLQSAVAACTACDLHKTRTQTVFGVGNRSADILVVGEAPGAEEDRRGEPFVGRAGKLLDEMLRAVLLDRDSVFIANVLKCRPPGNRDPHKSEADSCRRYLNRQIELLQPRVILVVGRIAAQQLLGTEQPLGRLRGQQHILEGYDLPVIVTYHPAYLLRSPSQKRKAWQDLCSLRALVDGFAA